MKYIILVLSFWLVFGAQAANTFETSATASHTISTDKILVTATGTSSSTGDVVDHMKIAMAYDLSCINYPNQEYHHSKQNSASNSIFNPLGWSYTYTIGHATDDNQRADGYPMTQAWANLSANPGTSERCKLDYSGAAGFSDDIISAQITLIGITFSGSFGSAATNIPEAKSLDEMMTNPTNSGGGGGSGEPGNECIYFCEPPPEPLMIDLGQDGIHLSKRGVGVSFDFEGNGIFSYVHWVSEAGNEAFLGLDSNDNGIIDNGLELFTDNSLLISGQKASHGFEALAQYDLPILGGNGDGFITSEDDIWSYLDLWLDSNADGISTANEMLTLGEIGITNLDITPKESNRYDRTGSWIPYWSWAKNDNAKGNKKYQMFDVFFKLIED